MPELQNLQLSDLRPGMPFRQYRLLEQIGSGGQGVVWSAHDPDKDRIVALKLNEIPNTDKKKAEDQIFERQVGSLVKLRQRFILPMYDYGLSSQLRYLVTPYIPGGSLEDRLNTGALSADEILRFAAEITAALDYLHIHNVVHRDLKPGNILMDYNQNLYVADFGLARVLSFSTQAMHTGRGTPPYASPEQHAMLEITRQSDLYSFGIMLYEMCTGLLPWNGEKILGIQQLNSDTEIPDPVLINPSLPAGLVQTLRRLTAGNPAGRPASAAEAMQSIYAAFHREPLELGEIQDGEETALQDDLAGKILQNSLQDWEPQNGLSTLSLTKFAYIELREKRLAGRDSTPKVLRFMLQGALAFGHDDDFWWSRLGDPKERLSIARDLLGRNNRTITARLVRHLIRDTELHGLTIRLPQEVTGLLLELALNSEDLLLRSQVIYFLRIFTPTQKKWQPVALTEEQDLLLALLALDDSDLGHETAHLVGQLRSALAVESIVKTAGEDRRTDILLQIRKTAGSLPGSIPLELRLAATGELISQRVFGQPLTLLSAAALIFAGAALSTGLQVYITYHLPYFMDVERITVSVERGIFIGAEFTLGILLVKLIVESFPEANVLSRLIPATFVGGIVLGMSLFIYDILFLKTTPQGGVMIAGCMLLAFGFGVASLVPARTWRIVISYCTCIIALTMTWYAHTGLAASPTQLSPIFFYEYTWSVVQVLQTVLAVSLPMAVLANLIRLSPQDE